MESNYPVLSKKCLPQVEVVAGIQIIPPDILAHCICIQCVFYELFQLEYTLPKDFIDLKQSSTFTPLLNFKQWPQPLRVSLFTITNMQSNTC